MGLTEFTPIELAKKLRGSAEQLDVHLSLVEKEILVDDCLVKIHVYTLQVDANGKVQPQALAEFMRNAITSYVIPRSVITEAYERDKANGESTEALIDLYERSRRTFTKLEKSGEGGELLLFLLAERYLKLPQVLNKMDLKTSAGLHYNGADAIHANVTDDGVLQLYWGESKLYGSATDAIRECLSSVAPFLQEIESDDSVRHRDIMLLSDRADLGDKDLTEGLKQYFDKSDLKSKRIEYRAVTLVGFDADFYPLTGKAIPADIEAAAREGIKGWQKQVKKRLKAENLEQVVIEFFCVPIPSAEKFRASVHKALGLEK